MSKGVRPDPWMAAEDAVAVPEGADWRVLPKDSGKGCRARGCNALAVAKLYRRGLNRNSWWAYCGEHLYGRWVEDGRVMSWVRRGSPAEKRWRRDEG